MTSDEPRTDAEIAERIDANAAEEHEIRNRSHGGMSDEDVARLRTLEVERDRLYDLKRLRQGRRDAGEDPGEAHERSANVVEGYRQ
ncbi:DUF2630 family protein [Actinomycetospora endophytica]|uniref:DUF2630 family protein n=1 Tax=Actinomycetospora endophytica TaxID=2291215 RepID=A0ABS8P1P1_9PSEU|nr:DUF2630 family protein [Actinomycetospora endophytica]MCD2192177.1 DUF2630 family protein [Actinomycetospora endophytica]